MEIIILPGNSLKNKEWARKIKEAAFQIEGVTNVFTQEYDHWIFGGEVMNLQKETEKLLKTISGKEDYVLIAKSAGTLICVNTINHVKSKPREVILMGLPVQWAKDNNINIDVLFKSISFSPTVIQCKEDPITSAENARMFLEKMNLLENVRFEEIPGNNHDYDNLEKIFPIIRKSIKKE